MKFEPVNIVVTQDIEGLRDHGAINSWVKRKSRCYGSVEIEEPETGRSLTESKKAALMIMWIVKETLRVDGWFSIAESIIYFITDFSNGS